MKIEATWTSGRTGELHYQAADSARLRREKPQARLVCGGFHRLIVVSLILLPVLFAAGQTPPNPPGGLPNLTTALQAHSLTIEQAKQSYPIHLRGVVTYFDPDYGTGDAAIFVHDATGSVFVKQSSALAGPLSAGELIDVHGVSGPGGFGPVVVQPRIVILGRAPLPPNPPRMSLPQLDTGAEDAQWVEVEGTIHGVIEYSHSVTLRLEMRDGNVNVTMGKEPGAAYSSLVDAKVRIHADAAPTINASGQMIGVHLMAPNLSAVEVVEPAPGDPFAHAPIPIDRLLHWDQFSASFHRVHLRGIVTLQWPGSSLCIRDATSGICVETGQTAPLAVGDIVDVAGFVGTENNAPIITDAVLRSAGNGKPVAPEPTTVEKILRGESGSELIQIEGQLIGYDRASSDATLLLSSGDTLFPAILPKSLAGPDASAWQIGSRLRVTGICSVRIDAQSHVRQGVAVPKSFRVLMRSPADVTILQRPSWWTPAHAIVMLALALIVTLGVLGWVAVLRRRVEQQANLLRESEQRFRHMALHDSLTGLATRLLLQDRLSVSLESARRRRTGLAILMVDLDRFKEVNDTYGHPAGDEVLRASAKRLLQAVRREDTVARIGGDEFVVLLPDVAGLKAVEIVAAKIVESLAVPVPVEGQLVAVSVSVGVCAAAPDELDADALLRNADAALYQAKERGRDCFQVFALSAAPSQTKA